MDFVKKSMTDVLYSQIPLNIKTLFSFVIAKEDARRHHNFNLLILSDLISVAKLELHSIHLESTGVPLETVPSSSSHCWQALIGINFGIEK